MIRLSVLDQSTIVSGRSPDTSIRESIALAQHCEALGYARYWCAEHHNSDSQAGTAPEILIAAIAATTQRIRVGSRGSCCRITRRSRWRSSSACWRRSRQGASIWGWGARRDRMVSPPMR